MTSLSFPPTLTRPRAQLSAFFVLSLLGYWGLRFWFPLVPAYQQAPLADARDFTPSLWAGLAYAALLISLFGLMIWVWRQARPFSLRQILAMTILFALPLLWTFPANATDVYRYLIRGRVMSVYGENPFATPPDAFPDDPFAPLAGEWAGETSPYGPVWELVDAGVTAVTGNNLLAGLLSLKLIGLAGHLLTAVLLWLALADREPAERSSLTLLWAWNPALLLTFVMDAHNDVWMIVWLAAGWLVLQRGRPSTGLVVAAIGALTKPIGLLALPFLALAGWRRQPDLQAKARFVGLSGAGVMAAALLTFFPFSSPLDLTQRLLREAGGGASFSVGALALLSAIRLDTAWSLSLAGQVGLAFLGLAGLWLLWRGGRGRSPPSGIADIFFVYVWQALNFRIWYAVWPFAWLLLGKQSDYRRRAGLWFLLASQLSVVIYGHVRVYLLAGDHLPAHLIGVPFTFVLPWILAKRPLKQVAAPPGVGHVKQRAEDEN